jgi:hypothetical protein
MAALTKPVFGSVSSDGVFRRDRQSMIIYSLNANMTLINPNKKIFGDVRF